jgi:hypothetical protein
MSFGNFLSGLAPVAAGFAFPGFGLLAGAATGAGIAALRDEDPLMGAVTGGLGGFGGGQLGTAAQNVTKAGLGSYSAGPVQGMGSSLAQNVGPMEAAKTLVTNPGGVISNLGGGDMTKGALKAGAVGLPAVAGAMVPDMTTAEMNEARFDPTKRLNLNKSTGLNLGQSGGLRLLQEGGYLDRPPTLEEVEAFRKFEQERQLRESMGTPDIMTPEQMEAFRRFEQDRQLKESMSNYQEGGYLETGMGDGVSDEIRASIDGQQPVLLSENEFVIPADVVSGLGNGSSDAGAEQLYAMMDRVRKARTGTEKMGREINAERLMPA